MLGGLPNLQKLDALHIGEHTEEMLTCDAKFQTQAISQLKDAVATCESEKDFVSRHILSEILEYEEEYLDWIETQQHLIGTTGIQNYLQSQMAEGE